MLRPLEVRPLPNYRLWVRFPDGVEGEVDLSHLAGRGVFSSWNEPGVFQRAYIGRSGEIAWSEEMEICSDNIYLRLTEKSPEAVFSNLARVAVGA
ncbi:MAG TPA: DUF2442 domain-containing protein [Acidobacteria bacterium]|nr:DUF2442 domain-containing protein [Acidobacteriota bacterium]